MSKHKVGVNERPPSELKAKGGKRAALERVKGIEPSYAAWEAAVLPLNYTRAPR